MSPLGTVVAKSVLQYRVLALSNCVSHLTTCVAGARFPFALLGSVWPLANPTLNPAIALRPISLTLALALLKHRPLAQPCIKLFALKHGKRSLTGTTFLCVILHLYLVPHRFCLLRLINQITQGRPIITLSIQLQLQIQPISELLDLGQLLIPNALWSKLHQAIELRLILSYRSVPLLQSP